MDVIVVVVHVLVHGCFVDVLTIGEFGVLNVETTILTLEGFFEIWKSGCIWGRVIFGDVLGDCGEYLGSIEECVSIIWIKGDGVSVRSQSLLEYIGNGYIESLDEGGMCSNL